MMNPKAQMRTAYLKMHAAIFLWGFTGLLGKLINLNEGLLVWYRMLISSIAIALMMLYRKKFSFLKKKRTHPDWQHWFFGHASLGCILWIDKTFEYQCCDGLSVIDCAFCFHH
ncbi:MAG: hypothetical protein IPP38_01175 [Bacteroidetes bacterium]|nr:hypothetical protein [Bacteroidota bacterium]